MHNRIVANEVIKRIASETDEAILFHSATGKDSICLLDLIAPHFKRIVCVYMYVVPNLQCVARYIQWAKSRYSNVEFVQATHYAVSSYRKYGYMGCAVDPKQKLFTLRDINEKVREKIGIEWTFYGMKESDGLNRRVMLRTYDNGICFKTKKAYPLQQYKNHDVLKYIRDRKLITPPDYTQGNTLLKRASSGESISGVFLSYLRDNFPDDLQKVYSYYPLSQSVLEQYDEMMNGAMNEATNEDEI